ncbi:hypothetical protein BV898_00922 [Hypsibius exemplaris]|uniref:Mediator of RNA polymerase II transcription subunit 28 n=1 Tax=Hypsibius exemplaris TaxID=2072580 RepID=A0A1W0XCL1_HYPEX|nr:hypothetical protein BV898_00922 [Hypsibius exemplaris]
MSEDTGIRDQTRTDFEPMDMNGGKLNEQADHASGLEAVVERILKNVMGDTAESPRFTPADTLDAVRVHADEDIKDLIAAHVRFEQLFCKARLIYSHRHPEKVLDSRIADMKRALVRKEALIDKHHKNLTRWQSILQNGIPAPAEVVADPAPPSNVRQPAPATPVPRLSPAAVTESTRAPSTTPIVAVPSPAVSLPPPLQQQQQQQLQQQPSYQPQPAVSPYPGAGIQQQAFPTGPGGMPSYSRPQQRPQGMPNPAGMGYGMGRPPQPGMGVYQPQQQPTSQQSMGMGGYGGAQRPGGVGVSPLTTMLQPGGGGLSNSMIQQMRGSSPNIGGGGTGSPGMMYGQNVSPRMAAGGQWRPNMQPQMQQQQGAQLPSGYGTDEVTVTFPQQQQMQHHPGAGGQPPG